MDYRGRQHRLQSLLDRNRFAALLVSHLPNIRYLCGFSGSSAVLLLTEGGSVLFSDGRYIAQARNEVRNSRIVIRRQTALLSAAEWMLAHHTELCRGSRKRSLSLGIEGQHLTVSDWRKLAKML